MKYFICFFLGMILAGGLQAQKNVTVKGDRSAYNETFIRDVGELLPDSRIVLEDGEIIIDGDVENAADIPELFEKDSVTYISGEKNGIKISLEIKALNYTDLDVTVQMTVQGKTYVDKNLVFTLSAGIILAAEVDETDEGEAYGSAQYTWESGNEMFALRIGTCGEEGEICIRVDRTGAVPDAKNVQLDRSPLLRGRNE